MTQDTTTDNIPPATETATEREESPSKTCHKCGQIKPLTEFCRHAYTADRLHHYCRACHSATISAGRHWNGQARARLDAASNQEPLSPRDEWHEMFMILVCGFSTQVKDYENWHGKDSPECVAKVRRVKKAFERLCALLPEAPRSPTGDQSHELLAQRQRKDDCP